MKNLKARLVTLTVSVGMTFALMMVAPALMGSFSQQDSVLTPREACATTEEENCCSYDTICNLGSNTSEGNVGFEYYEGKCEDRGKEKEENGDE